MGCLSFQRHPCKKGRRLFEALVDGRGALHWQRVDACQGSRLCLWKCSSGLLKQFFFAERELLFRFEGGTFYSAEPERLAQAVLDVRCSNRVAIACQGLSGNGDRRVAIWSNVPWSHSEQGGVAEGISRFGASVSCQDNWEVMALDFLGCERDVGPGFLQGLSLVRSAITGWPSERGGGP